MKARIFQCYFLTCSWGEPKRATDEKWKCKWELVLNMFSVWLNHCHRLTGLSTLLSLSSSLSLTMCTPPSLRKQMHQIHRTRFRAWWCTLKHFGDFVSKVHLKGFNLCKSQKRFTGSRYFLQIALDLNCCRLFFF